MFSTDYTGMALLNLPLYWEIMGLLKLIQREIEIITKHAKTAKVL